MKKSFHTAKHNQKVYNGNTDKCNWTPVNVWYDNSTAYQVCQCLHKIFTGKCSQGEEMYCGRNKIALSSQKQIADTMLRLLTENSYAAISVSMICREAGVSRQTFYSLFQSKENVIIYMFQEKYCYSPEEASEQAPDSGDAGTEERDPDTLFPLEAMCRGYSHYMVVQRKFIRLLVDNDITYLMHAALREVMESCECFLPDKEENVRTLAADFMAGGMTCIARHYIQCGLTQDEEELSRLTMSLFNGKIFGG